MRPTSRFHVNSEAPRARGVCDFCGQQWQHSALVWQFEWVGPRLQNQRKLVCPPCNDKPQPQLRTIVLPPDPIPIMNARVENYVSDDNPLSPLGVSPNFALPQYGSRIGNLTGAGGINAAFDGVLAKQSWLSAANKTISNSSFNNYVGINWQGAVAQLNMPSSLLPPVLKHTLSAVVITAPLDSATLHSTTTTFVVQASPVDTSVFGAWTTVANGTARAAGASITIASSQIAP